MTFHADDVVAKLDNPSRLGVVERTHGDVDTHMPIPPRRGGLSYACDPSITQRQFTQFLKDGVPPVGTVVVQWDHEVHATLLPENKLKLLDRSLLVGDIVRRTSKDAMSGVVINTFTKCTLQPCGDLVLAQNNKRLKGILDGRGNTIGLHAPAAGSPAPLIDIPISELKYAESLNEDDIVLWKDRIGRIDALNSCISLRLSDNCVVEIHEDTADFVDGAVDFFSVGDIARAKKGVLRQGKWIYGRYNPNTPPIGTVVAKRFVSAEITWLQRRIGAPETEDPPTTLETDELEADGFHVYDRTRRPNVPHLTSANLSNSEIDVKLGLRVRFKDLSGACVKYDGSSSHGKLTRLDRSETLGYDLNVFGVASFHTDVEVQWQDLSISHEDSINLIPDTSIDDDHAVWPGEIAHTVDLSPIPDQPGMSQAGKVGVIQKVNAQERMATVRWCPTGSMVYATDTEAGSGGKTLCQAVVGRAGEEQQELSLYEINAPALSNVRRGDIVLLISGESEKAGSGSTAAELDWIGEIVDTPLDGSLTVRLGALKNVRDVTVPREFTRVAVRSDGTDEVDGWGDEAWEEETSSSDDYDDDSDDSWPDSDEEMVQATYEDENGMPLDEAEVEAEEWESEASDEDGDAMMTDAEGHDAPAETPPTSHSITPPDIGNAGESNIEAGSERILHGGPEQYLILESTVPSTHAYRSQPSTESVTHMKRLQKEHKILRTPNALPQGVYVRSWESRLDLLRVLFVGPTETPYSQVPFVVDFYLPASFPAEPPQAFFHSWSLDNGIGGSGRVNPNLYEDGKICLSLLGTWDGDKGEGWVPARSTVLQVLVSILGLVLVQEPYFNEAGYETLVGLESSRRPSALYNERTFLRATAFIIKAVEWLKPPSGTAGTDIEGLEDVVRWLYKDASGSQFLKQKIADVKEVLQRSEGDSMESDGMKVMSRGACIPLKRLLARLKEL